MDILELIKTRKMIRKYTDQPIPKEVLDKIIEAGIWGPSVTGKQPWKFCIITDKDIIKKICEGVINKSNMLGIGARSIVNSTMKAISTCQTLIGVYNTEDSSQLVKKIAEELVEVVKISEIKTISAAIQNMLLAADSLGIGSGWFDAPILYENFLNEIFNEKGKLIAVLGFGYPAEEGRRTPRKPISEMVKYI